MAKIEMTIAQLEQMLIEQKLITVEQCLSNSHIYNKESTGACSFPLPIDDLKFKENGMKADYPNEFNVLKKYIKG